MSVSNYIPLNIDIATINTNVSKNIFLPATSSIYGKTISIKDITGFASLNNIIIRSQGVDSFQDSTSNYIINKNFGVASFFAKSNIWYLMNDSSQINSNLVVNSVTAAYYYGDGGTLSNIGLGVSSLSSIVAYGLSSIHSPTGVSSLSSIVAYGLSSVNAGDGVSSLSSIVAYGLSTLQQQPAPGVSSLSSIVAYGLSSLWSPDGVSSISSIVAYGLSSLWSPDGVSSLSSIVAYGLSSINGGEGISSLSSIVAYGLSSVNGGEGISSLSSIVAYGLSSVNAGRGVSSLSSIVAYGLSSVNAGRGVSSLSSIVAYGLSSINAGLGVSSLSSIVAYGLSSVNAGLGVSSLSSIVAYGLSTVNAGRGVSSLSSIVAYGLSSVNAGHGVSTLSSIVAYGLSSVNAGQGVSTLSSIVAYGLSSVNGGDGISSLSSIVTYGLSSLLDEIRSLPGASNDPSIGISSLSSIVAYGLSSLVFPTGISSLSSIVAYGLSSVYGGHGVSSLSSIVAYGLSSVNGGQGVSSLSSIVSYGLSSVHGGQGLSSLSSIVAYGFSTMYAQPNPGLSTFVIDSSERMDRFTDIIKFGLSSVSGGFGISSLSSIVSYGLSSVNGGFGISSLSSIVSYGLSSVNAGQGVSSLSSIVAYGLSSVNAGQGVSSLSSIVAYGLSSVNGGAGLSSLSSIVAYGLSSVNGGAGISSLSSIVAYGLSSVNGGAGISSLSSIVAYGLSTVSGGHGISSLSSIVAYGLSSVNGGRGISSLSSIVAYGLSSVNGGTGISSLSSIVAYGLSSVNGGAGVSSLSSIIAYGLSTVNAGLGVSSLSSIVAYGLSSVNGGAGLSSLSSIVAYGLSTVSGGHGISSLSSIVAYGLSSVNGGSGVSSLSSIVAYGLSTVSGGRGISSLSSIVAYGLSSVNGGAGLSSLSSIVAYGLSSVNGGHGVSSLSSIVAYGLSSVNGGDGISSLSSIVAYGLSSVNGGDGISSLSSIVAYGLSSVNGGAGISSLSSIVSYGLSSLWSPDGISSLSSIVVYGLSSLIQSSLTVTTVGPMTLYGKGGVGLSTIDTAPPDTITNAFAKVDHWLFSNLVDQPPAPLPNANSVELSSRFYAYQTFDAPFQFKSAFMSNVWLPSIFSLNVNIFDDNSSNISCNITDPIYLPRGSCNLAGFYFDTRDAPPNQPYFPYTFGTISNLIYINIKNYIPTPPINPYTIEIFYSNYSAEPVHKLTSQWLIFRGAAPAAPNNLSIDTIGSTTFNTNFRLSNSDSDDINSTAPYSNAFVNIYFSNTLGGYPRRYQVDTNFYDTYSNINIFDIYTYTCNSFVRPTISNLPPDTPLYFNTYTTNVYTSSNGALSSNSAPVRTLLPDLVGNRLSIATLNGSLNYPSPGLIYSNISLGPKTVLCNGLTEDIDYYKKFAYITFNNNTPIVIHTQSNPGSSGSEITSVQLILDNVESNIYNFDGFPITTTVPTNTNVFTYSELTFGEISDSYDGLTKSNFYLKVNYINYFIFPNFFTAQATPHIITSILSNQYLPICNVETTIYSDRLQGLPSIANISNYRNISNDGKYGFVSGLLVLSNSVTFDLNVDVGNFAQYFYPAVNIFGSVGLSYQSYSTESSNIYSNVTIYDVNDSSGIGDIAPDPARFKLNNVVFSPTVVLLWTNGDVANYVKANVNNLTNIVGQADPISCNLQYYFDSLSLDLINTELASVKSNGGLRMEAASNSCNTTFIPYDHSQLISGNSCNNYNLEIPLLGGFHTIGSAIGTNYTYINNFLPVGGFPQYNYPDYSAISGETVTRYATFKYSLSNSRTNFVKLLEFNFNSYADINNTGANNIFNSTIVPTLWYKIDNSGPYNTGWLNGNVTKNSYLAFNSGSAINGAAGLRSNDIYTPIVGAKRYFSMIPIPSSCNFDVYVKIGLKTAGKFDYIKIGLSNGSTPAAPTAINLSQTRNAGSNFNLTAQWTNPTGYGPIISNTVIACNVIVAGYPCRWVSAGNEYFDNTVTCNVSGTSSTFPVINANTYYDVYIKSLNDIDFGSNSSNRILTQFPNTDLPFYNTSKSINMNTSYYSFCNAIPFGSSGIVQNIQNYNTVMSGSHINFNIGTDAITFNYESNQAGSNLSKMSLYVRGTVNVTTSVSQYQFNNSLYSNTSLTTVNGSNGVGLMLQLSNLTDKYPNASWPTISGFYYTGKVFFNVSNTFITPSNYGYSFILSNSSGSNLQSSTYYFDNLATTAVPTINSVFVDTTNITDYFTYVSGILTFRSTCNYSFWIQASNLGSNFYRNPPVRITLSNSSFTTNFPFVPGTTKFYSTCNIGTVNELTSVANSQNNTYFYWPNVSIGESYTFLNALTVNASASNLNANGINSNFAFMDIGRSNLFFDSASILLRDATKNSNYPGTTNYGLRVESGVGAYPTWNQTGATDDSLFGFSNNDNTLLTGPYTNELQIVNGAYVGTNVNCNYLNAVLYTPPGASYSYPNYSGVYTTGGTRYATFMWYIATGNKYSTVQFNINGNNFLIGTNPDITQYVGGVTLQYLAIGLPTPTFTANIWPPAQLNRTTAWLDGNSVANLPYSFTQRIANNTGGALSVSTNPQVIRKVTLAFGDTTTGRPPFLFFVRVGIPTTSNFSFNNVELISLT